jgi:glyoxylase-like metal-dependent hydrolase (beta-lactamase superfamily II)
MKRLLLATILMGAVWVTADAATLTVDSHARARQVLDRAVNALGGAESLRAIDAMRLELEGEFLPRLQMPTPAPPFDAGYFKESLLFDLKNNRLRLEQRNKGAGFEGHATVIIKAGEGVNYDHRARTATPIPAAQATQQQFVQYFRRVPHLLLRQALERTASLRYLGEQPYEQRKHQVITFVMPDTQQVALYVDAGTGLVSKYELLINDPLRGEQASEIAYADYVSAGKTKMPQRWIWRIAGDVSARYALKASFNPADIDQAFEFADADYRKVPALPLNLKPGTEKLAEGVIVIHDVAGPNQNTMAIEFKDFVLAVEAPGSSDGADEVIKRIKEEMPGKPIRYLAVTHHHGDHIGGLRSFVAEGATVVTTRGNRALLEQMAAARQNDRLGRNPRKPEFMFVDGKRVISDGERTVELIDIGPNPHAKEMVIAYLPKQRIVFQGDLFFLPANDAPIGPAQDTTLSFARQLRDKKLEVERIASVHGRTATMAEFTRVVDEAVAKN